jgi:hypothetical protein
MSATGQDRLNRTPRPSGYRALLITAVLAPSFIASLWLLGDASTFALAPADPVRGTVRGCYTSLERLLGVTEPSSTRGFELLVGLAMFLAPVVLGIRAFKRRAWRHAKDAP